MQKTKLSWPDYKKAALKLRSQGLGYPKIYDRLGIPMWDGKEYKLESDKGNIKRKTREASRAGKTASTKTRTSNQALSTPKGTDTKATNQLVKEINASGGQADHKAELSRSGNALRPMDAKRRQLYLKRMGNEVGHQPGNIQNLSKQDNLQKNIDYRRFDSYIRNLAKRPHVGQPMFGANLAGLAINYLPMVDEITGGHIEKAINKGMESLKIAGQKAFDAGVSKMLENRRLGYDLTIQ
tara:strand:- start:305 stop:1021 length:717 start_codon:yes stop_codon:yes gene_type:complete